MELEIAQWRLALEEEERKQCLQMEMEEKKSFLKEIIINN